MLHEYPKRWYESNNGTFSRYNKGRGRGRGIGRSVPPQENNAQTAPTMTPRVFQVLERRHGMRLSTCSTLKILPHLRNSMVMLVFFSTPVHHTI